MKYHFEKSADFIEKWNSEFNSNSQPESELSSLSSSFDEQPPPTKKAKLMDVIDEAILNSRKGLYISKPPLIATCN